MEDCMVFSQSGSREKEGALLLVDGLHKLADDERHTLDALDLFLGTYELTLQAPATSR